MSDKPHIRPPAVAGMFYPAEANILARDIHACLAAAPRAGIPVPKALIVPHAGYVYSGGVAAAALRLPQVSASDAAHSMEHALEVQLPFLQSVLDDFTLVPFVVGAATPAQVAAVIDLLWGGPETLILISSDLSHFHSYTAAQAIDRGTVKNMLAFEPLTNHEQACGAHPQRGQIPCSLGLHPTKADQARLHHSRIVKAWVAIERPD